jgi:hypothetical protein
MSEASETIGRRWRRRAGVAAGWSTQALFAYTVWRMLWFLKDGAQPTADASLAWDALLALQFAIPHSVLLHPAVRARLSPWIAAPFYGLFFCAATCGSMLATIAQWQASETVVWECAGPWRAAVLACFAASWVALFGSIRLTGLGYQTGYTPWSFWVQGQPVPRRTFAPRGAYWLLRHPVYLSFLGLLWFTPRMTLDHALLTGLWTIYIFVGSWLKDRRLAHYVGEPYLAYAARVPGYPLAPPGPLGRLRPRGLPPSELGSAAAA